MKKPVRQIEPYCVDHYITCETIGDYVILDMRWDDEDWYGDGVEGEGSLDGQLTLRDDVLQQDYCVLHLAWLSALHTWEMTEDMLEPPVPPGLQQLTPPLRHFIGLGTGGWGCAEILDESRGADQVQGRNNQGFAGRVRLWSGFCINRSGWLEIVIPTHNKWGNMANRFSCNIGVVLS